MSKGNNNNLKIKIMTKYYVNGKQISEQEANEIKKNKMQDYKRVQT